MIRGAQKKMIVIRTHDSRVFEEAYFVMRRDSEMAVDGNDMLAEADRIIRRSTAGATSDVRPDAMSDHGGWTSSRSKGHGRPWIGRVLWFLSGLLLGGGGAWLVFNLL